MNKEEKLLLLEIEKRIDIMLTFVATKVPSHLKTQEYHKAFADYAVLQSKLYQKIESATEEQDLEGDTNE